MSKKHTIKGEFFTPSYTQRTTPPVGFSGPGSIVASPKGVEVLAVHQPRRSLSFFGIFLGVLGGIAGSILGRIASSILDVPWDLGIEIGLGLGIVGGVTLGQLLGKTLTEKKLVEITFLWSDITAVSISDIDQEQGSMFQAMTGHDGSIAQATPADRLCLSFEVAAPMAGMVFFTVNPDDGWTPKQLERCFKTKGDYSPLGKEKIEWL